jgi:hypothetical protein
MEGGLRLHAALRDTHGQYEVDMFTLAAGDGQQTAQVIFATGPVLDAESALSTKGWEMNRSGDAIQK